jgi:hypothetical protein
MKVLNFKGTANEKDYWTWTLPTICGSRTADLSCGG